jgi:predicted MPP superfamily phosphohydrolase
VPDLVLVKKALLYGSWLAFPFAAWMATRLVRGPKRSSAAIWLVLCAVFVYARFVEPGLITVDETRVAAPIDLRVALVSDVHVGLYKSPAYVARLVDRLNALDVELVLFAGDWTYEPDAPLVELLAPLRSLKHRAYSVPGNHDSEAPGPPIRDELKAALAAVGVNPIENGAVVFPEFVLVGLGDRWGGDDRLASIATLPADRPLLALMHNPDSALDFPPGRVALAFAGHTHGGQIRIPWLYKRVIPTVGPFDRGLHELPNTRVFVTSGVGEIGLPLRFLVPPVIDVIRLARP